jgi:NAD(P) transhydrogenase subunit alpha
VIVEAGAGAGALLPDEAFTAAGATIGDPWSADVVAKVAPPSAEEIGRLGQGSVLIGFLAPLSSPETAEQLSSRGVNAFAMEKIPRSPARRRWTRSQARPTSAATARRCWPARRCSASSRCS